MASSSQISAQIQEQAASILAKSKGLSQRVAMFCNRLVGESDALAVEIKGLQQAIRAAESEACRAPSSPLTQEVLSQLKAAKEVLQGLGPGGDLRRFCTPRLPFMLRLLLGNKVHVVAYRADQSIAMKEEYHRFRDRAALIMLVVPALLLLGLRRADALKSAAAGGSDDAVGRGINDITLNPWRHTFTPGLMTGVQLYFLWLSYFYLTLALRENVLLVNGSAIKGWWIQHHYWSAGTSLLLLGLPVYSDAVRLFCQYFLMWSCFQAVVMMFQNHYQRRRMYTRIALGKSSAMDVVSGESSGTSGQLILLYPLLILLQVLQFAIGAGVAAHTWHAVLSEEGWLDVESSGSDLRGMRGVCCVGVVFCFMAVRNFQATVQTIIEKRHYARRMKKSLGKVSDAATAAVHSVAGGGGKGKST